WEAEPVAGEPLVASAGEPPGAGAWESPEWAASLVFMPGTTLCPGARSRPGPGRARLANTWQSAARGTRPRPYHVIDDGLPDDGPAVRDQRPAIRAPGPDGPAHARQRALGLAGPAAGHRVRRVLAVQPAERAGQGHLRRDVLRPGRARDLAVRRRAQLRERPELEAGPAKHAHLHGRRGVRRAPPGGEAVHRVRRVDVRRHLVRLAVLR